ncbi:MAG: hypothetical protein IPO03_03300 [Bacteroidetes bacterium]|nr:hypothetical protein [Bacteroidota bacterium]
MRKAKYSMVNYQQGAIPKIIELLKDTTFIKLQNTGDLIYLGALKFCGNCGIAYYDIDWISVRAAWLPEEITFQDFIILA